MLFNKSINKTAFVLDSLEVLLDFRGKRDSKILVFRFLGLLRTSTFALWFG